MKKEGGWIFISHSHQDIDIVRKIRNRFEELGYEPLMFYLKCLNDHDEIEELIKREIDEREWFVYVDSQNARNSDWVKSEREYISGLKGKKIITIDVNGDVIKQVDSIARNLKVFISYSTNDWSVANKIQNILIEKDYLVIVNEPDRIFIGDSYQNVIGKQIESASREGFVIALITENKYGTWMEREIEIALKSGAKIIPIYVDNAKLTPLLQSLIGEVQGVHISSNPTKEELLEIVSKIEHQICFYRSDFTMSIGFKSAKSIKYPYVASIPKYTFWDCDNLERVIIPNCVSYISEIAFMKNQDVLVLCEKNSYAESFCIEHNVRYQLIESFEDY